LKAFFYGLKISTLSRIRHFKSFFHLEKFFAKKCLFKATPDHVLSKQIQQGDLFMPHKPDGYPSVSPYLIVRDAERALCFLEEVFDAQRLRVIPREDGDGILHAEARIDDSVVMMGEMSEGPDTSVHIYVDDVDATIAKALTAGAILVQKAVNKGDGDYRGGVADGNGAVWWIARQEDK